MHAESDVMCADFGTVLAEAGEDRSDISDQDSYARHVASWKVNILKSIDALKLYVNSSSASIVSGQAELSLVQTSLISGEPTVSLVHWFWPTRGRPVLVAERLGREVVLDEHDYVKYSTDMFFTQRHFTPTGDRAIVVNVGVSMSKMVRPRIPGPIKWLSMMWEAALDHTSSEQFDSALDACCWCGGVGDTSGHVFVCAVCMLSWHHTCDQKSHTGDNVSLDARSKLVLRRALSTVSPLSAAKLCSFCKRVQDS